MDYRRTKAVRPTQDFVKIHHEVQNDKKADELSSQAMRELVKKTHFTYEQVQALSKIYSRLTSVGRMDRMRFRDFISSTFDMTEDIILERLFNIMVEDNTGAVSETQWIMAMSVMTRGTLEEKINYVFKIYDVSGDGNLTRDEVSQFLRNCMTSTYGVPNGLEMDDVEDAIRDVGDIVFRKLDMDRNGFIDLIDFQQACTMNPLLLESMGHCLPSTKYITSFLILVAEDYKNFNSGLSHQGDPSYHTITESRTSSTPGLHSGDSLTSVTSISGPIQNQIGRSSVSSIDGGNVKEEIKLR